MQVRHSSFVPFKSHLCPSDRIDPGCITRAYGLLVRWHRSGALSSDACYRAATLDPGGCGTHPGELKPRGQRLHSRTRSLVQGARATALCASLIYFPSQVRSCSLSPSSWVRPAATRGCAAGVSCRQTESDLTARCRRGGLGAAPPTRASL
jgi:hypothetical protein